MMKGMTRVKIAITIPGELLDLVKDAVERGEASSVSAYISDAVAKRHDKRPLETYLDLLKAEYGEPSRGAYEWADEQVRRMGLSPTRRRRVSPSTRVR